MNRKLVIFATAAAFFGLGLATSYAKGGGAKGGSQGGAKDPTTVFDAIDANDDGVVTAKELGDSKRFQDKEKGEVVSAFKAKDLNGDGGISLHEFTKTFGSSREKGDKGGKGTKRAKGEGSKEGEGKRGGKGQG